MEKERGVKEKGEGGGLENAFNSASPVNSHAAAVSIERTMARLKKRGVKSLKSIIKMPLILACPTCRKNIAAQKVLTPKPLVFPVNLCQPVFPEKNVFSFGKQCSLAGLSYEEVLPVTKTTLHNGTFHITRTAAALVSLRAGQLSDRPHVSCLCRISQPKLG